MSKAILKGQPWPARVCDLLRALAKNETNAKSRLQDRTEYRSELEEKLRELGREPTPSRMVTANELVNCQNEIKYQRTRIKTCAANTVKTILDADQGKLDELFAEVHPDLTRSLFEKMHVKEPEEEDPDGDDVAETTKDAEKPDHNGQGAKNPRAPKGPKARKGDKKTAAPVGVPKPGWQAVALEKIEIPAGVRTILLEAKITTLGAVAGKIGIPANDRAAFNKVADEEYGIGEAGAIELGNALQSFIDEFEEAK